MRKARRKRMDKAADRVWVLVRVSRDVEVEVEVEVKTMNPTKRPYLSIRDPHAQPAPDPSSRANRNIPSDSRAHLDPFGRHAEINADDPHLSPPVAKRDLRTTTYESPSVESFEVELERGHTGGRQRGMTRSSSMSSEGSERIARVEGGARETGRLAQGHESSETLT
jgi:hypothetical protein